MKYTKAKIKKENRIILKRNLNLNLNISIVEFEKN